VNNINDCTGSDILQVFDVSPGMSSVGIGGVNTFSGEIVEILQMCVQDNLLLIGIFEGFRPGYTSF